MFRISAKVVLCNSVTLDLSGGFLLMMLLYLWPMLLLVVCWITVTHFSGVSLSSMFVNYSASKIVQLESYKIPVDIFSTNRFLIPSMNSALSSFEPVSEDDILKILKSSPTKSCDLDQIPTSLVKDCADILITPITNIINYSLKEGSFPNFFKIPYVTPLLKKPSLDRNLLKNYKPVSNLSFISKLIEKAVANQLNSYINKEGLSILNQSAYKRLYSTETPLLKIQNNIVASMDSGKAVALTLLALSAAFHKIDHTIILTASGIGLAWMAVC